MTRPDARLLWRAWWPALVVVGVGVIGYFAMLDALHEQDDLWKLDEPLLEWFALHRVDWVTDLMVLVSWIFGPVVLPILVAIGGAIWGWRTAQWFNVMVVVGSMIAAALLAAILKAWVGRPRPPSEFWQEPGSVHLASFPSGHTLCATTLVLVTGYLAWRTERSAKVLLWWSVGSFATIAMVALSRLYLGYHFLTDVVAGAFCGVFLLGIAMGVVRTHDLRLGRPVGTPLDPTAA